MNDRLGELPSWATGDDDDGDDEASESFENEPSPSKGKKGSDLEMGRVEEPAMPKHMEHFFREVESIKEDIELVKKATEQIEDINEAAVQVVTTEDENELSRKLRPLVDGTNKRAKRTKTLLGLLKEETKKLQADDAIKPSDLRYVTFCHSSVLSAKIMLG